jgi:hypothetical protein
VLLLFANAFDPLALDDDRGDAADVILSFNQKGDRFALLRFAEQTVCVQADHPFCHGN